MMELDHACIKTIPNVVRVFDVDNVGDLRRISAFSRCRIHRFTADRHLGFFGPYMRLAGAWWEKMHWNARGMHCLQCIFPTRHQLNDAHKPSQMKLAVGRENDE
jgi:hypothetical protein